MTGVLITGHGNFASGLISSLNLVAGEQKQVALVDFKEDQNTDTLRQNILEAISGFGRDILILADIQGGSPYNISVTLKTECSEKHIEVLSGCNLPMLLASVFEREDKTLNELAERILLSGKDNIRQFKFMKPNDTNIVQSFDDGI